MFDCVVCRLSGNSVEASVVMCTILSMCVEKDILQHARMVTTEISQVPLSGVLAILKAARCTLPLNSNACVQMDWEGLD